MNMIVSAAASVKASDPSDAQEQLTRIGEMAKEFGITLRTLRFYEDKGLLTPIREGASRLYTRRDKVRLKLILLGRKVGFSLREVKQMIDLYDPHGPNVKQLKITLEKSEKQIVRLQKQRAAIDEAIEELGAGIEAVRAMLGQGQTGAAA